MTIPAVALLAASFAYAGFQWTIRGLVYPQFVAVPPAAFEAYERAHQHRVSIVVGPLFVAFGAASVAAFATRPDVASAVAGASCAGILLVTALLAVPLHRTLSARFDAAAHARLLRVDSARLVLAVIGCGASVVFAVTG